MKRIAGSSAGSICAGLLSVGCTPQEIADVFKCDIKWLFHGNLNTCTVHCMAGRSSIIVLLGYRACDSDILFVFTCKLLTDHTPFGLFVPSCWLLAQCRLCY